MYCWFVNFMFWNSGLGCTGCPELLELQGAPWSCCFWSCSMHKFPWVVIGAFLSTHLRISDFWLRSGLQTVSRCYFHSFSFNGIPRIDQIPQIQWRIFLTPRAAWCQLEWSRFRWYHRLWFCHWWAFTWSRLLTSFWHRALLSDQFRKKIIGMTAREHRETHNVKQTKKMIPFVTRKTSLGEHVGELVFGLNRFDLDLGF